MGVTNVAMLDTAACRRVWCHGVLGAFRMKPFTEADFAEQLWARVVDEAGGSDNERPPRPILLALCAEPGMGAREVVSAALAWGARLGTRVLRRDLGASSPESATQFLTRLARRVSQTDGSVLVGLDELPPCDEARVARQVRALRRMWSSEASVVLSVAPEGAQLLEELPECKVLRAPQLLCLLPASDPETEGTSLASVTRGIPSLVASLGAGA